MDKLHKVLLSTVIMHLEMAEKLLCQIADMYYTDKSYDAMGSGKAKLQIKQARNTVEDIIKAGEQV